jgi:hypothetical protein
LYSFVYPNQLGGTTQIKNSATLGFAGLPMSVSISTSRRWATGQDNWEVLLGACGAPSATRVRAQMVDMTPGRGDDLRNGIPKVSQIRLNADFWRSPVDCDALRDDRWNGPITFATAAPEPAAKRTFRPSETGRSKSLRRRAVQGAQHHPTILQQVQTVQGVAM